MTVILTILKILGILLLTILCLILLAALLFLFVPFCYRADGSYKEEPAAGVRVTWLLHLISFQASFDGAFTYCLRAAGIRLLPRPDRPDKKKKPAVTGEDEMPSEEEEQHRPEAEKALNSDAGHDDGAKGTHTGTAGKASGAEETKERRTRKESLPERLRGLVSRLYGGLKKAAEQVSWYKSVFETPEVKRALHLAWEQLCRIVRHVMPRKTDICLIAGTGDPALTGQLLAVQGMLYPLLRGNVLILPDFEQRRLEGSFHIKGHVTAFTVFVCALRIFFNRDIRYMIKRLRKKEEVSYGGE